VNIELGLNKKVRRAYGIDEIALVPGNRTIDYDLTDPSWSIGGLNREVPIVASAMDSVVDVNTAVELTKLGSLGVINMEGIQTRYEKPDEILNQIASVGKNDFVPLMQKIYSEPVKEGLIVQRINEVKERGGIAAFSGTPQAAIKFKKTLINSKIDLFFLQGTVVSTEHLGMEGKETLNIKDLCPLPIGLTRSINLGVRLGFFSTVFVSTSITICLLGYSGVRLSKAILCLDFSGSSRFILFT